MDWRMAAVLCALLYGCGTYCLSRANPVHGAAFSVFLQWSAYAVLLILLGFGLSNFEKVTRTSLTFGALAASCFVVGTFLLFYAFEIAPARAAVIDAISASYFIVAALFIQVLVRKQTFQEWTGMFIILVGVLILILAPARDIQ